MTPTQLTPNIGSKATNTYTNNNYHTPYTTNKNAVSQYNKCNQVPPVLSSKDRLIKEHKDFTCCDEVALRIFLILSISFYVLIPDGYRRSSRKAVLNLSLIVQYKKKCASSSTTPQFYPFKPGFCSADDVWLDVVDCGCEF
jgi:hypothetical protein